MKNDPLKLEPQLQKIYSLNLYLKWLTVLIFWLSFGLFGIWELREEITLWQQYFTWSALRYALVYHRLAAVCLSICIGLTVGLLITQSRDLLWGISEQEKYRLQQQIDQIFAKGKSHPFYKFLSKE
jgi:hypothetical protein